MRFGVPILDQRLTGAPVLLRGLPGVDTAPFINEAIRRHDTSVVYLAVDQHPERIQRRLSDAGIHAELHFLDGHTPRIGMPPVGTPVDVENPGSVVRALESAAHDHPDALLVLDGLGSLALLSAGRLAAAWPRIVAAAHRFAQPLAVFTQWDEPPMDLDAFGDEIRLLGIQKRIISHEYFRVRPRDGAAESPVLYRHQADGLHAYIPKVVVTGPSDAGKSTFIGSLCKDAVHTDRKGTTVAGDRGTCVVDGVRIELFGTPGQARFDKLLPKLIGQAVGVVFMVDATNRDDFQRARQMLDIVQAAGRHLVVVANKMDHYGAIEPERLAAALSLTDDTPVLACSATSPESAQAAMQAMLGGLLQAVPA